MIKFLAFPKESFHSTAPSGGVETTDVYCIHWVESYCFHRKKIISILMILRTSSQNVRNALSCSCPATPPYSFPPPPQHQWHPPG